jgi:SAM-dependent methyltransferase
MIGLASGSWAQVIANHPEVEKLTVVDINPGYLQLIPKYKVVASLLHNPKVTIVIDDGRRWLVRNPEAAYDVIVMNTTYNWRSNTTNLLSVEFLQLAHRHLSPGGVLFYNTTYSARAQFTGVAVFPYGLLVGSCMAVSDSSIDPNLNRWKQIVTQYKIDGVPVFRLERDNDQRKLAELISMFGSLEGADQIRKRTAGSRLITDDNMGSEW